MVAAPTISLFTVNPIGDPLGWLELLLASAGSGDLMAATILLLLTYLSILVINKFTDFLLIVIRKLMVFALIASALYYLLLDWVGKMAANPSPETIVLGVVGLLVGVAAFSIALYSLVQSTRYVREIKEKEEEEKEEDEQRKEAEETKKEVLEIKEILTLQSLKDDKSLGAVLAYMMIAQFGIFSSKTISAPSNIV
ncbi:hypothetical protein ACFLRC_01070, partial [Candidatus Altiarchaeota archaeon]